MSRAKTHIWIQGDLQRAAGWGRESPKVPGALLEGCSLKALSSSVLFRPDPSYGFFHLSVSLPSSLPPCPPSALSQPLPATETLNRNSQDRVTAAGCYCPGLGNLSSLNLNIFLAEIKPRIEPVILPSPFLRELSPPTAWAQSPLTGFPFSQSYLW